MLSDNKYELINQQGFLQKTQYFLCIGIAATLPFFINLNSVIILALGLTWLLNFRQNLIQIRSSFSSEMLVSLLMFILFLISYLLSTNMVVAGYELEKKLSFLAFPLIFGGVNFLTNNRIRIVIITFILSCILASLICLVYGIYKSFQGDNTFLFYQNLTSVLNLHAVYFSVYIAFGAYYLIHYYSELKTLFLPIPLAIAILYLIAFLIILSSKTIIVSFALITGGSILFRKWTKKNFILGFTLFVLVISGFLISITKIPFLKNRFDEILKENYSVVLHKNDYRDFHFTGGTIRLAIWKTIVEVLNKNDSWLLGEGIGDSQDVLTLSYNEKNIYPGDDALGFKGFTHYNAHNQYMQQLIDVGLIGLSLFILFLFFLIRNGIKANNNPLVFLALIFGAFCLTESALSAHKGIVFFLFFTFLLSRKQSQIH